MLLRTSELAVQKLAALVPDAEPELNALQQLRSTSPAGAPFQECTLAAQLQPILARARGMAEAAGAERLRPPLEGLRDLAGAWRSSDGNGLAMAEKLLRDERSERNPCLLLLSTAACGYTELGPMQLELDMCGKGPIVDAARRTVTYEAAEVKASSDGEQHRGGGTRSPSNAPSQRT